MEELKAQLEKLQNDIVDLQKEKARSAKLEKELDETKKLVESYKTSSKTVYVSHDKKLQKFSGRPVKDSDSTAEEWIEDAIYHLKNIDGHTKQVEFVYDHLSGQAKDEVRLRPESERNTASKILNIIRETFEDAETVGQIQQRFFQRNQKRDESLQSYSLVLMKLADRMVKKDKSIIGDRNLMLTERFIDGVMDHQLRREMRRFFFEHKGIQFTDFRHQVLKWTEDEIGQRKESPSSIHEITAEEELVQQQANVHNVREKTASKVNNSETGMQAEMMKLLQSQQEMLKRQQEQIDMLAGIVNKSQPEQGSRSFPRRLGITCYYCQKKGHIAKDCLQRKRKESREGSENPTAPSKGAGKNDSSLNQ